MPPPPDPRVELDAALEDARAAHRRVRNDTARAVAELTMLDRDLDAAADEVGQCRALAADALRKAEAARAAGDEAAAARWERTARGVAGRLVSAEDRLTAPAGLAVRGEHVYVSNNGLTPGGGEVLKISTQGW